MKRKILLVFAGMLAANTATGQVGVNTNSPSATLDIVSKGNTSATKALEVNNSSATEMLTVLDNGNLGIGVPSPQKRLDADANNNVIRLRNLTVTNGPGLVDGSNYLLGYDPATGDVQAKAYYSRGSATIASGASATFTDTTNSIQGTFLVRSADGCGNTMAATFVYARRAIGLQAAAITNGALPTVTTSISGGSRVYEIKFAAPGCSDGSNSTEFDFTITKSANNTVNITNNGNLSKGYAVIFTPVN